MSLGILERLEAELLTQREQLSAALARIAALESRPATNGADRMMSVGDVVRFAKSRKSTVIGAILSGELPAIVRDNAVGRRAKYLVKQSDVETWLRNHGAVAHAVA